MEYMKKQSLYYKFTCNFSVNDKDVVAYCEYGKKFASTAIEKNIFAAQFHPERVRKMGLSY